MLLSAFIAKMRATSSAGMTYRIVGGLVPIGFCGISKEITKDGSKSHHQTSVVTTEVLMGLMCCLMCVELTRGYKSPIFASHCVEALNPFAELLWQCYKLMSCCGVATMCSIGFAIRCRKFVLETCMDKLNVRLEKLKTGYRLPPTGDRPFKMLGTGPLLGQALQNAWDRPF